MINRFKSTELGSVKGSEITPERKAQGREEYCKQVNQMIVRAVLKHLESVSYRAFRVACSVIADNPKIQGGYEIRSEHNFKPWRKQQYGWDKLCAENNACSYVIVNGAEYIPCIVVVSQHKKIGDDLEDDTHSQEALHSCKNCRQLFREMIQKGFMSEETIIRFVDDSSLLDEDFSDMQEFIIENGEENGEEPLKIQWPSLKLKENVTEANLANLVGNLPSEEMTMKEFLNLPKYRNDGPPIFGNSIPPYQVVYRK